MQYKKYSSGEQGQVLLIIVLVMVVALTVGLSLASRSIIQVKTATEHAESQKAFSAAEAGIEQALQTGQNITAEQDLGNNAAIKQVNVSSVGGSNQLVMNNGDPIRQDDGIDLWLSSYSDNPSQIYLNPWSGTVNVYWGTDSSNNGCNNPAIEIIVLKGTPTNPTMDHYAVDPCSDRRAYNNFTAPDSSSGGYQSFIYRKSFTIPAASPGPGLFARIIPLYKDGQVGVTASSNLPTQGRVISSTGEAGATQRKITLFQGYQSVPTEFFYSLFSPK